MCNIYWLCACRLFWRHAARCSSPIYYYITLAIYNTYQRRTAVPAGVAREFVLLSLCLRSNFFAFPERAGKRKGEKSSHGLKLSLWASGFAGLSFVVVRFLPWSLFAS